MGLGIRVVMKFRDRKYSIKFLALARKLKKHDFKMFIFKWYFAMKFIFIANEWASTSKYACVMLDVCYKKR
jgi:hypothetical protein